MTDQPQDAIPDPVEADEATGVGVYNETLERFVGGVFATSKDAQAFIREHKDDGHKYVTRKV